MMNSSAIKIKLKETTLVDIKLSIISSLALVGQSGSGKSLTLKAFLGMLPSPMQLQMSHTFDFALTKGENIGFIPQNPFTALSPLTKIKKQFFCSKERLQELFSELNLSFELLERFAPELSGGQLQRVVIAMALQNKPKLLLLDEPTTALDPQTRELIINLLKELQKKEQFLMLFVTHDIASAQKLCEDICVIKEGKIVEFGKVQEVLQNPQEPYTKTLIEANFAQRKFRT